MEHEPRLQASCHWCNADIYEMHLDNVKSFWNDNYIGYPICDDCYDGLETNGRINEFKKEFIEMLDRAILKGKGCTLDKWI
jgi:hypothetical protein